MDNNTPHASTPRAGTVAKGDRGGAGIMILLIAMLIVVVAAASQIGPLKRYLSPPPPMPVVAAPAVDAPPSPPPAPPAPQITQAPEPEVLEMATLMLKEPPPAQAAAQPALPSPPAGEAGLVEAMRKGVLRPASGSDLSAWKLRWSQANGRGVPSSFDEHAQRMTVYAIQGDLQIPSGLSGAHAVVFVLGKGVPYPRGDAGHSVILDQATGACMGPLCEMLLQ